MKLIYLKSALKCNSFDVCIGIKILFFRVLVTIEPGRSLIQFVTTNCLIAVTKIMDETSQTIALACFTIIFGFAYLLEMNKILIKKEKKIKLNFNLKM